MSAADAEMGEPAPLSKEELSKKLVQEISQRGDQVPDKYIHKDGFPQAIDAPVELWRDTLVIDFSLLSSFDDNELAKLKSALSNWGCFQIINHGIERSFLEELIEVSKQFFALPLEERCKCSAAGDVVQGYGSDAAYAGNKTVGWNDRLALKLYPEENRTLKFWPQKPRMFRELLNEYTKRVAIMIEDILKAMARCLDLQEDCFLKHMGKPGQITGRLVMYPRCPCPDRVLGVKPHSDGGTMTVLLAEKGVEGLQIQKNEQWFKVPVIPGALFINLGDLGEIMSNGIFKSVIHRVVTNSDKDRVSVAAFCAPEDKYEIGPVGELISTDRPQQYKRFNISEFRKIFFESYAQGRRAPDALKI